MTDDLIKTLRGLRDASVEHLDRLGRWQASGGRLDSFPDGKTIEDMIEREDKAIKSLTSAIDRLQLTSKIGSK